MKPTFIGIGAQKCASSWLYQMLKEHPQVTVSETKELDFFSYRFENGFRWYEAQFPCRPGAVQAGEISPSYFHEPGVVERVVAYAPDARVIVSLRDPVERALSQHRHLVRQSLVPAEDLHFETALASNPTYVEQGLYARHLRRWFDAFGRDRVHVVLMDDIKADAGRVVTELYAFLGLDAAHRPATLDEHRNPSYLIRRQGLHGAVRRAHRTMRAIGADKVWRAIGDLGLRTAYRRLNRADSGEMIPAPESHALAHLRERFGPDIDELEGLLDRDLRGWRLGDTKTRGS